MKGSILRMLLSIIVVVLIIGLGQSCGFSDATVVWYGITDQEGVMLALEKDASHLLAVRIPYSIVTSYREQLAQQGIESDDLGAVQYLFGLKGDHYFKADAIAMNAVRDLLDSLGGRFSVIEKGYSIEEHRIRTLNEQAMVLSKNPLPDTLAALAGPRTTGEDITKALRSLAKQRPEVMYFDVGAFLDPSLSSDDLKRWTTEWTTHALRAAAR
ncbi:MAG: hypothetical protein CVV52_10525 [Spirochaetae bacterium HGW-Spirochaetae-8]|nr:MAG: hypothetical protein CVV52_10525 [Spirochaetae bacterium HGW-Spirochaetae-8]